MIREHTDVCTQRNSTHICTFCLSLPNLWLKYRLYFDIQALKIGTCLLDCNNHIRHQSTFSHLWGLLSEPTQEIHQ